MHAATCSAPHNPKKGMCPLSVPQTEMVHVGLWWSSQYEATADHVGICHDKAAHPLPDAADVTYHDLWILYWPPKSSTYHMHRFSLSKHILGGCGWGKISLKGRDY